MNAVDLSSHRAMPIPFTDITVTPMGTGEILSKVMTSKETTGGSWIANYNLHALYLSLTDRQFAEAYAGADYWIIDGWPIKVMARVARRFQKNELPAEKVSEIPRVGSTDWVYGLIELGRPVSILAVGGTPSSSKRCSEVIAERFPWVTWLAFDGYEFKCRSPHHDPPTLETAMRKSDVVLVGMGMPHQESWISENRDRIRAKVVANVGGCFDYMSGEQRLAPRWMGEAGIEWLFRFLWSPKRLFRRYFVEPLLIVLQILKRIYRG